MGRSVTRQISAHWDGYQCKPFSQSQLLSLHRAPPSALFPWQPPPFVHLQTPGSQVREVPKPERPLTRSTPCRWESTATSCSVQTCGARGAAVLWKWLRPTTPGVLLHVYPVRQEPQRESSHRALYWFIFHGEKISGMYRFPVCNGWCHGGYTNKCLVLKWEGVVQCLTVLFI